MSVVEWNFYQADLPAIESKRNLPHIDMPGVLTFVTMRLADSMPRSIVEKWHAEIEAWLSGNGLAGRSVDEVLEADDVGRELKAELRQFKNRRWHGHLDDCHGSCIFRDGENRKLLSESFLKFDGERYDIERFVIMPNHAHLLIQMRAELSLRKQFRETQRYSARQINQRVNRRGELWQTEPFDHLVRSEDQFRYLQSYISENPSKANLRPGEYTLWLRPA